MHPQFYTSLRTLMANALDQDGLADAATAVRKHALATLCPSLLALR